MSLTSGQLDEIAPGVRRLVARNPGFMTGPGTNTYLVGTQQLAPNTGGADNNKMVREVGRARYDVPITQHIRVTLEPPHRS